MGILIMQFRKQQLQAKKNNLEYKLLDLDEQINNYTQLSSTLSSDSITPTDLASMPASLFGTGMTSIFQMNQSGQQYANQVMSNMDASIFQQYGDNAQYMQQLAYQKAYEEGQKQYKKLIQAQLNEKEKDLQRQRTTCNTQLTMTDEELKNVESRLTNDIKDSTAGYGLGGG